MLYDELKIFMNHGYQTISDVAKVKLTSMFRGRPEMSPEITEEEAEAAKQLCPVSAIQTHPFGIHLGKCVFCKECQFLLPGKIRFTNDYRMATNDPQKLLVLAGSQSQILLDQKLIRAEIKSFFGHALKLRQVSAGGDNSCEMELNAAGNVNFDMGRWGIDFVASPRHADGLVVTGPISENMAEALELCYKAIAEPKVLILVGADAISGGIFADSKALNRDFLDRHKPDLYVPGNPAHPLTFVNGILDLIRRKR